MKTILWRISIKGASNQEDKSSWEWHHHESDSHKDRSTSLSWTTTPQHSRYWILRDLSFLTEAGKLQQLQKPENCSNFPAWLIWTKIGNGRKVQAILTSAPPPSCRGRITNCRGRITKDKTFALKQLKEGYSSLPRDHRRRQCSKDLKKQEIFVNTIAGSRTPYQLISETSPNETTECRDNSIAFEGQAVTKEAQSLRRVSNRWLHYCPQRTTTTSPIITSDNISSRIWTRPIITKRSKETRGS